MNPGYRKMPPLRVAVLVCLQLGLGLHSHVFANELDDFRECMRTGQYEEAITLAKAQVDNRVWNEVWPRVLIDAYLTTGEYEKALKVYESALERFGDSIRLRLLGAKVYQYNEQPSKSAKQLEEIESLLQRAPWRYSNRSDLIPLGEFFLLRGEDPKQVLKICFDQAVKLDPKNTEAHVAIARMALDKNDSQVAAQALDRALKLDAKDPEILFLSARAWADTERGREEGFLKRSLEANPRFIPSLLLATESQMNSENYAGAIELLEQVQAINPNLPRGWALQAAISHLVGDYQQEGDARRKALRVWKLNPEVDYTIGKHLSLHYRFREGADYQRRALTMDSSYAPSRAQLAQDLLRLGETDEGWKLVEGIRTSDPYDVSIFNLKQLESKLARFATLESPGFVIRMDAVEAEVYGADVIKLLTEARATLVPKYAAQLDEPIFVEIFPRQQEFAIRTFGLPGGAGFLGVCFGRLITANSPAALNVDANWRSVLWHEYCHVVTLQKTKNKMPRWLSEGISVYEERLRDSGWGERLDPVYREMLLSDNLVPISQLSGSFLQPKSPLHLQFAYYTSSLAVEFWIERWGIQGLQRLLEDLSVGMRPEEALARMPGSLVALDAEFLEFARGKGTSMSPHADFEKLSRDASSDLNAWLVDHPNSYWGLKERLKQETQSKRWDDALATANALQQLWPDDPSEDGIYRSIASIHRERGDLEGERAAWGQAIARSSAPREALLRMIEIDSARQDWKQVLQWCDRLLGIAPLSSELQWTRSRAAENAGDNDQSILALKATAALNPIDPAQVHFRLAKAMQSSGETASAKRYCLMALEESPRYAEALALLVQLQSP